MKIAMVMATGDSAAMSHWLATACLGEAELERWIIDAEPEVAEQVLGALVIQWRQTPVDMLIFPASIFGDELATRLAWRLQCGSVCQVLSVTVQEGWVTKSHWGNALIATLEASSRPLCLSLARQFGVKTSTDLPEHLTTRHIVPDPVPGWLASIERIERSEKHPLQEAKKVLVVGQGGERSEERRGGKE